MNNLENIDFLNNLISSGSFNPKLESILSYIQSALSKVNEIKVYTDKFNNDELVDIYNKRLVNLSAKDFEFGGFEETISCLKSGYEPKTMFAMDSEYFHYIFLIDINNIIVGAIYVEN